MKYVKNIGNGFRLVIVRNPMSEGDSEYLCKLMLNKRRVGSIRVTATEGAGPAFEEDDEETAQAIRDQLPGCEIELTETLDSASSVGSTFAGWIITDLDRWAAALAFGVMFVHDSEFTSTKHVHMTKDMIRYAVSILGEHCGLAGAMLGISTDVLPDGFGGFKKLEDFTVGTINFSESRHVVDRWDDLRPEAPLKLHYEYAQDCITKYNQIRARHEAQSAVDAVLAITQ